MSRRCPSGNTIQKRCVAQIPHALMRMRQLKALIMQCDRHLACSSQQPASSFLPPSPTLSLPFSHLHVRLPPSIVPSHSPVFSLSSSHPYSLTLTHGSHSSAFALALLFTGKGNMCGCWSAAGDSHFSAGGNPLQTPGPRLNSHFSVAQISFLSECPL